jgi:hypothetical protein
MNEQKESSWLFKNNIIINLSNTQSSLLEFLSKTKSIESEILKVSKAT